MKKIPREIRFCGCDCGGTKEVPINSTWKYFPGHNTRVTGSPFKRLEVRRLLSEQKIGDKNPAKRPEVRDKMSISQIGKKQSQETKDKRGESLRSSMKFKEAMKNRKPPREGTDTSSQARENMRNGAINRKITPEFRESRRQGTLRALLNPEVKRKRIEQLLEVAFSYRRGYVSISASLNPVFYRSSYERDALLLLDKLGVLNVQPEKVHIPYVDEFGKDRIYVPDFLVTLEDGRQLLIEVKPKDFVMFDLRYQKSNIPKFRAAQEWAKENGAMFCIWTEDILYNNSSTTTSLQEIVEATVANHFVDSEMVEGIV